MNLSSHRIDLLKREMDRRILVLDGAMGTSIQDRNLPAKDFGGEHLEGCNENLVLTRPDVINDVMHRYLEAGADIIETNTFGATPMVLGEYGLSEQTYQINFVAAQLARESCEKFSIGNNLRWVAGSLGPTTKAISVTGGITFSELIRNYTQQALGLINGGCDFLLLETCQDTRNIKAAIIGIQDAMKDTRELPIAVSGTIEPMGTMLAGQNVEALATSLMHCDLLYLGLNCATGPSFMTDHLRTLALESSFRLACVPNAGLPDEYGQYRESPESLSAVIASFAEQGWLNFVGGCCGTTPAHIRALANAVKNLKPRQPKVVLGSVVSGLERLEITDEKRPLLVGERTNVIGSKKFRDLVVSEKWDEAAEIAKTQVKNGAHIIDVCLANPDRDELSDIKKFLDSVVRQIKAPIMIDSTDAVVIAEALTYCQGKAIINSINLEDGEERFELVLPLVKKFGAAVVVGCIDDDPVQGMAISRRRKVDVADRSYRLLTEKYAIAPEDIYWDALVFPCGTGDQQYVGSAHETIEGIRLLKEKFPRTKTVLGVSNVSFGLPTQGREVLNSIFLYHCVQAGLDMAIVNSEKLVRYPQILDVEKTLAENLIFNQGDDPVAKFAAHFRTKKPVERSAKEFVPLPDRLSNYIIEGTKNGLVEDLGEALKTMKPLTIINGPLMKGMDEVGRLFNGNKLIVAEVLQSAESMKVAVNFLEPFMEKTNESQRGTLLLATVKGDVHDIGKNLVDIILSNNGFRVINLGIKIPPETLIQAVREHKPDFIGLSGLLVKSAQQMVTTAKDLKGAGIKLPILVGGAALSRNFVDKQIAPSYEGLVDYAKDAMHGLELSKKISDTNEFIQHLATVQQRQKALIGSSQQLKPNTAESEKRSSEIQRAIVIPTLNSFERRIVREISIESIWKYINPLMLYVRHLGIKPREVKIWQSDGMAGLRTYEEGKRVISIFEAVEEVKRAFRNNLVPKAIYQNFRAKSQGNSIHLLDDISLNKLARLRFPRQRRPSGLCLSDYVEPIDSPRADVIGMFVVTVGENIRSLAEDLKQRGEYLRSIILQVLALESAEAFAELLHEQIRIEWGIPDSPNLTMMERFQAKYLGKRFSYGYPACPDLTSQELIFQLLKPDEIQLELTEGFMMDPEASVSALVFHHPQATYFSVGSESEGNA